MSNVKIPTNGLMSHSEYEYIISLAKNKKILIFGTGNDTLLWKNISSYSIFLEHDINWITKEDKNIYLIEYNSLIDNYEDSLKKLKNGETNHLLVNLPEVCYDKWDVILVDAPTGFKKGQHGRSQSIYSSYILADYDTNILIHDYNRQLEKSFSDYLFGNPIKSIERLAHFKKK